MMWLTGSCYAHYEQLRHKHIRHHVDRADIIGLGYQSSVTFGSACSAAFCNHTGVVLRSCAVELLMHAFVIALPFLHKKRRAERCRMLTILVMRGMAFATLGYVAPQALVLYVIAHLIMITVLRFADAFQHTYDAYVIPETGKVPDDKLRDKPYEQSNTYST